jgi:hypothetical protein
MVFFHRPHAVAAMAVVNDWTRALDSAAFFLLLIHSTRKTYLRSPMVVHVVPRRSSRVVWVFRDALLT